MSNLTYECIYLVLNNNGVFGIKCRPVSHISYHKNKRGKLSCPGNKLVALVAGSKSVVHVTVKVLLSSKFEDCCSTQWDLEIWSSNDFPWVWMNTFVFSIMAFNAKQTNYGTSITEEKLLVRLVFSSILSTAKTRCMAYGQSKITWVVFGTTDGMRKWLWHRRK